MTSDLVIVGAGGFGREVIDVVLAVNAVRPGTWNLLGVVDDGSSEGNQRRLAELGVRCLGPVDVLTTLPAGTSVAIAIGAPLVRSRIVDEVSKYPMSFATLAHPTAVFGSRCVAGEGLVACSGSTIGTNVRLGRHVHLNPNSTIGHDTVVGDLVSLNPMANVSGDCLIGDRVLVGASSVVLEGRRVEDGSVIGAGAVVVHDVTAGKTVKGVPAR